MIADIGRGTGYLAKGLTLVNSKGIRRFVVIPLLLNIFLFGILIRIGYSQFVPLVDGIMSYVPGFLSFLESIIWIFITVLTSVIVFFLFTPIANIIAAPFNAIMAEKIEIKLTGKNVNSNASLLKIIKDSIMSQIGKLMYIIMWSLVLLLISIIPVINIISPILWILFGSWLLSLEYLDYPMGNHDLTFKQQKAALKKRRGLSLGFGGSIMLLTSIPIINFFVMPLAVAGATAMWVDQFSESTELTGY